MANESLSETVFLRVPLEDTIAVPARFLDGNLQKYVSGVLSRQFEGVCTHNGFILPGTIKDVAIRQPEVRIASLNGDVVVNARFSALVCNPVVDDIVRARVVDINAFGVLAHCSLSLPNMGDNDDEDEAMTDGNDDVQNPIVAGEAAVTLEIVVSRDYQSLVRSEARNVADLMDPVDFSEVRVGQYIDVRITGKRFVLNSQKISAIGCILTKAAVAATAATDDPVAVMGMAIDQLTVPRHNSTEPVINVDDDISANTSIADDDDDDDEDDAEEDVQKDEDEEEDDVEEEDIGNGNEDGDESFLDDDMDSIAAGSDDIAVDGSSNNDASEEDDL